MSKGARYYVLTDTGVHSAPSLRLLNRKLKIKIEETEFSSCGADRVAKLTANDLEFLQDKRRLEAIPIGNLYKTDGMQKYIMIFIVVLQFIILVKG